MAINKIPKRQAPAKGREQEELRELRADARQNRTTVLEAAAALFADSGVDAPVREIAERAGVGLGTVYRHFPQRSDLIVAVIQSHVDACVRAATDLASKHEPGEALLLWLHRLMDFVGAKRGLVKALHSGDPAYAALPEYVTQNLGGALRQLLYSAIAAKVIRLDIDAEELLWTVATMCHGPNGETPSYAAKMVTVLFDGLRYRANPSCNETADPS